MMKAISTTVATSVLMLVASDAFAQEAAKPTVELPPVTVETTQPKAAPKKKAVAKKAAPQAAAPVVSSPEPSPPSDGAGATETGIGPVNGIVATRSMTGTKTDTPLIEVPKTVNVVTKDQITQQQPKTVREALAYTPAVQSQTGASSILDNIAVRGFAAPIFLDGLPLPTDQALSFSRIRLEPYGLERLEVLKGPSSGLFGQSPPGGLINAVSKRPQDIPHNEVYAQFGTDNYKETGFDFTGPVDPEGIFSYRLVGLMRDTDLDFDFADRQRYYIAPSFTWRSDDTTLTVLASAQRDAGFGPHQFVPLELTRKSAPFGRVSRSTYFGEPGVDDYSEDQWKIGYAFEHRFDSVFQFRQNVRYAESSQDLVAMRAAGMFDPDGPFNPGPPPTGGPTPPSDRLIARGVNAVIADTQGFAIDNQVQADFWSGPLRHKILAGLDYQHVDSSSNFWVNQPPVPNNVAPIDAYDPVYGAPIPSPFAGTAFVLSDSTLEQTGVYLQDQIKLERWIVTLGLRHDWATTKLHDKRTGVPPEQYVPFQEVDDQKWTGFAGLSYVFDNGFAPYINYSTSFLPATGSSLINSRTDSPLKPTTGEGYEAGIKYQPFGTKTLLTAAAFQVTQQNVSTSEPPNFEVFQTGEVRVRGFEIEGKASLTDNFDILGGYSYIEPIITSTLPEKDIGNDFQQVSRHLASLWGMYTWHDGPLAGLGLGAGVRYVGTQWAEAANIGKVPAYTLVDAAITYDLKYVAPEFEGAKLQLNAFNLFDEYYVSTCQGSDFCHLGETRTFLATLKYDW